LHLPRAPLAEIGPPAHPSAERWRAYRATYDWTIYSPEQLEVMETYWDACVALYETLLPPRFAADPGRWRGVNLGTFNGAFQKAWMRRGYRMYGIEYHDVIDELQRYGCAGEQANFFFLDRIRDDEFDFAVMDRAYFRRVNEGFVRDGAGGTYVELGAGRSDGGIVDVRMRNSGQPAVLDGSELDIRRRVPPFFENIFRVLREDGAFLGIFYQLWQQYAVRELHELGGVSLWPIVKGPDAQPYLALRVDRQETPQAFPEVATAIASIVRWPALLARWRAQRHPLVGKVVRSGERRLKFHYLPSNHLVEVALPEGRIVADEIIPNVDHPEQFFATAHTVVTVNRARPADTARTLVVLVDSKLIGEASGLLPALAGSADAWQLVTTDRAAKGTRSLMPGWQGVTQELEARLVRGRFAVLLGGALVDVALNRRTGLPNLGLDRVAVLVEKMVDDIAARGGDVWLLLPPAVSAQADDERAYRQMLAVTEYRAAFADLGRRHGCRLIDIAIKVELAAATSLLEAYRHTDVRDALCAALRAVMLDAGPGGTPSRTVVDA